MHAKGSQTERGRNGALVVSLKNDLHGYRAWVGDLSYAFSRSDRLFANARNLPPNGPHPPHLAPAKHSRHAWSATTPERQAYRVCLKDVHVSLSHDAQEGTAQEIQIQRRPYYPHWVSLLTLPRSRASRAGHTQLSNRTSTQPRIE